MAGFGFDMENLVIGDEMTADLLFGDAPAEPNANNNLQTQENENEETEENNLETQATEIQNVTADELFGESEEVGSLNEDLEDTSETEDDNSPDNTNFYSSIANALVDDGVFQSISPDDSLKIKDADSFRDIFEKEIQSRLDDVNKRVYNALNSGVEPNSIKYYESTLSNLNNITPELINEESERGEDVRRRLIQLSFINRGYSDDKAIKMTKKLFDSGDDIEEAKEALEENKKFFSEKYLSMLDLANYASQKEKEYMQKLANKIKDDIMNSDKFFNEIEVDKGTRKKIVDNIMRPSWKDPLTGNFYTKLKKYEIEHPEEYIKTIGYIFTLTDEFTNINKFINPQVKKLVKSTLRELEGKLSNQKFRNGKSNFVSSANTAKNKGKSVFDNGYVLDI